MNGIPDLGGRADLADRAVPITLSAISERNRRPESELRAAFEDARPEALGALLDAISAALGNYEKVKLDRVPRMADFAKWVTAAEPGLGWKSGSFMEAYTANRASAVELAVENDPVAGAVRTLAEEGDWEGSASELLPELERLVSEKIRESRTWPRAPNALSIRLRRAAPGLRQLGVEVEVGGKATTKDRKRLIVIQRRGQS